MRIINVGFTATCPCPNYMSEFSNLSRSCLVTCRRLQDNDPSIFISMHAWTSKHRHLKQPSTGGGLGSYPTGDLGQCISVDAFDNPGGIKRLHDPSSMETHLHSFARPGYSNPRVSISLTAQHHAIQGPSRTYAMH